MKVKSSSFRAEVAGPGADKAFVIGATGCIQTSPADNSSSRRFRCCSRQAD
ncbi:MAG: hypothetical protein NDJ89_19205 [Oligoflexia bacterium]|nr:hypothetical protein [Oligoflexia bacterium]